MANIKQTSTHSSILFIFYFGLFLNFSPPLLSQIKNIWTLGDGEKVFRNDLNHPLKKKNFIWDGETIRLKGLYNEIKAFQIIVETGNIGVKGIDILINRPINKSSGKVIGGNTLMYGDAGTIEIFTQHYLNVQDNRFTHPAWFYGSEASAPKQMTGWIPDALIPTNAKEGLGGLPIEIGPERNQGFWIDVHLPKDQKNYPNGLYIGSVHVLEKGKIVKEIPLEINLLPEYLPDKNKTNVWLYTSSIYSYFPELSHESVDKMLKYEGHRHRIDVVGGFEVNRSTFNLEMMNKYKPWLDGSAYTKENGYWGPGQDQGENLFIIGMYGTNVLGNTKTEIQNQADKWVTWFNHNAPNLTYFWYITDEPPKERYPWIKERSEWIKNNSGPGKKLPIFTTIGYKEELSDVIDYWSSGTGVELEYLAKARKNGGDYTFYNGFRPRYGSVILEGAAVDFRVNSWILYKYGINYHFIWHGTHWKHNGQGPKGNLHQNVFQNPLSFANFGQFSYGNGDGILFYPGKMPFYPEENRGINSIITSIRLKNIRRGQQDALILEMAEKKIGKDEIIKIINKIVPRALSEVEKDEPVPWSENGDDYDKIIDHILNIILENKK